MNNEQLFIVVFGIIGLALSAVIAYMQRTRKGELVEIAQMFQGALDGIIGQADEILAKYGEQLKPVHDGVTVVEALVDESDDWLIGALAKALGAKPEDVIAVLKPLVEKVGDLTDGAPEPETVPPQGYGTAR